MRRRNFSRARQQLVEAVSREPVCHLPDAVRSPDPTVFAQTL
jgi:hypothetical protein